MAGTCLQGFLLLSSQEISLNRRCLNPISYPLASADGSLAKTNKAMLLKVIEQEVPNNNYVIDTPPQGG